METKARTHKLSVENSRGNLSAEQIRINKCQRSLGRNAAKRKIRQDQANSRNDKWNSLTIDQKLDVLKGRPGQSKRQTVRILAKRLGELNPLGT